MFCSSCGAAVTPGLNYCNRCGAGLSANEITTPKLELFPDSLVWAIVSVSVGGLGVLIGLMAVMKEGLNFSPAMLVLFSLLAFLLLFGAEAVLIWLLLRSRKDRKEAGDVAQLQGPFTRALNEGRMPVEPAGSVTEHTTHTLEPVYRKPQTP